jgi:hypothetical protein
MNRIDWRFTLQVVAFFIKDIALPFIVVGVTALALIAAYRRGLFTRTRLPTAEPRTIIVHGDVMGGISATASNLGAIALDATKVDEYHRQSIAQSRISFWFSLIFASLGFLIIATSVFTYTDKTGYLGVVAGTIVDAIAALFFYQSNRARTLMADFFDRLRSDHKIAESLKLCADIDEGAMRDALRAKLSLHFSGLDQTDESLRVILGYRERGIDPRDVQTTTPTASDGRANTTMDPAAPSGRGSS